jgi:hypothetical protein
MAARLFFLRDFSASHKAICFSSLRSVEVLGALPSHLFKVDPATPVAAQRSFCDRPTTLSLEVITRRNFGGLSDNSKRLFESMFHLFAFSQIICLQEIVSFTNMIAQTQAEVNSICKTVNQDDAPSAGPE